MVANISLQRSQLVKVFRNDLEKGQRGTESLLLVTWSWWHSKARGRPLWSCRRFLGQWTTDNKAAKEVNVGGNKWVHTGQTNPNFTNTILDSELTITEWQLFPSVNTSVAWSTQPSAVLQRESGMLSLLGKEQGTNWNALFSLGVRQAAYSCPSGG